MPSESSARLAVLIDADNAQPALVAALLAEVAKYGTAHVKRAYGDWTDTHLRGWKEELLAQSIQPIQQFGYTRGKNATDSALIIDAMDLLYSGKMDGFCIVSSDSDFTRLAGRVRESGLVVYGFGERKTPEPFVAACDKFVYVENLSEQPEQAAPRKPQSGAQLKQDAGLLNLLRGAVDAASDEDGWAQLGPVGSIISKQRPDFDARSYGYGKLSDLVAATSLFEIERRSAGEGRPKAIHVRNRSQPARR
ncbi:MAG: NYN domain-containing protein [Rhodanobacteraceae bacterium]